MTRTGRQHAIIIQCVRTCSLPVPLPTVFLRLPFLRQYVSPVDEPHAFLEEGESPPTSFSKRSPAPKAAPSPKGPSSGIAYSLPDDRPLGPQHQVSSIPPCRQRPAQPTQWEARFLSAQPLFQPLGQQQQQLGGAASSSSTSGTAAAAAKAFKAAYQAAPGGAARRALLGAAVQEMDAALGQQLVQVTQGGGGELTINCLELVLEDIDVGGC